VGAPRRREIGHGNLAERALVPVLPTREDFPYAIRQVSEALGSNGSTSMGSVCASTLSLLNAGVPLRAPVAGIAMGLMHEVIDGETKWATLTDILGSEDAFGDMDFKVAGTRDFTTALQLEGAISSGASMAWARTSRMNRRASRAWPSAPASTSEGRPGPVPPACSPPTSWPRPSTPPTRWPPRPRVSWPCASRWTRSVRSSAPRAR